MSREPVDSTLIRSVGFDPASSILEVELTPSGRVYRYFDVPFSAFEELMAAGSKGAYFNAFIRDMYAFEEVEGRVDDRLARARRLQLAIRAVLLADWDPIGVAHLPEARGEYDAYVGELYSLLARGATRQELIDRLRQIETDRMGLFAIPARTEAVADRLLGLPDEPEGGSE